MVVVPQRGAPTMNRNLSMSSICGIASGPNDAFELRQTRQALSALE
jgi:hypothetical protein